MSVQPVKTEFGRKTQIDQPSCNKDYSCLEGNCPSFVKVIPSEKDDKRQLPDLGFDPSRLPSPKDLTNGSSNIFMLGIGGTGVVTVNQIVATAAFLENKKVVALDQTGLSQKGGSVVSHLKILSDLDKECSSRVSSGESDVYLVFDLLTGTNPVNLSRLHKKRSMSVISTSEIPTGDMVRSTKKEYPDSTHLIDLIKEFSKENILLNATELSEHFFDSNMQANFIVVGAAYQSGYVALNADSILEAIKINGVVVKKNQDAFNLGRKIVADPNWLQSLSLYRSGNIDVKPELDDISQSLINKIKKPDDELKQILEFRVPELVDYQNVQYAEEYINFVKKIHAVEKREHSSPLLTKNVARYLYKLMAVKDEYEVARLSLKAELNTALNQEFGKSAKIYYMLHPPFLKMFKDIPLLNKIPGVKSKLALPRWFKYGYMALKRFKFVRGTKFDFMAWFSSDVRKTDKEILHHYKTILTNNINGISNGKYEDLLKFSELPDLVRGYEEVRLATVDTYYKEADRLFKI